ncbi:MAG: cytochrome c-type biogenesis protein CcmH [Dehalococcoidia bacterium]|nr:cytochrome c-type biogenesis protein CcmH [Dehalococcoidia bacterium]
MKTIFVRGFALVVVLALSLFSPGTVQAGPPPTVDEVATQLVCQCGCTSVLNNCTHAECTSRETMLGLVKQGIAQGQTADQIVQFFANQYGEKVLASPTKKGFNLTAWITPFAAIILGGIVVYLAIKKWLRSGQHQESKVEVKPDDAYWYRVEKELKDFPEKGFR